MACLSLLLDSDDELVNFSYLNPDFLSSGVDCVLLVIDFLSLAWKWVFGVHLV